MASHTATHTPSARGGFWNLLRRENTVWWGGSRWWVVGLLALAGLNGLLAFALFLLPAIMQAAGQTVEVVEAGAQFFFVLGALAVAVAAIILSHDAIVSEKQSGVTEWVLSKPVRRSAYVLAKLAGSLIGTLAVLVILQSIVAGALFAVAHRTEGLALPLARFVGAVGLMGLHTAFYLILTIALGVFASNRTVVLGVPLAVLLGGSLLSQFAGPLALVTPWLLPQFAAGLVQTPSLPAIMWLPAGLTALWSVLIVAAALWAFELAEL